ncbi:hypothetical protein OH76DRAFT_1399227 [Lentinus brumalis]|uniref:Uncharacterized protein n=1 Tax=Lentinus brumalis TaxID=2498619 RepID=A0A371DLC3_9APHY|nr:hypothetical protein OH76DRAFT_1399227 [Polyporus brumalis]
MPACRCGFGPGALCIVQGLSAPEKQPVRVQSVQVLSGRGLKPRLLDDRALVATPCWGFEEEHASRRLGRGKAQSAT